MGKRKNYLLISGIMAILFSYGIYKENKVHKAIRSFELGKIELFTKIQNASTTTIQPNEATIKDWHHLLDKN